jgi:hypothetical protein
MSSSLLYCVSAGSAGSAAGSSPGPSGGAAPRFYRTCRPQNPILSDILNFLYLTSITSRPHREYFTESETVEALTENTQWSESEILRGLHIGVRQGLFLQQVPCNEINGEEISYAFNPRAFEVNPINLNYILPSSGLPSGTSFALAGFDIPSRQWPSAKGFTTVDSGCNAIQSANARPMQTVTVQGVGTFTRAPPVGGFCISN